MSVLAVYESVEAMAGDEDALRRRLASLDGWVAGQADSGLVTTPMREQLSDAGIVKVSATADMPHIHALLLPAKGGGRRVTLSRAQPWDRWPLLLAHELGHARCPSTIGTHPWMGVERAEELVECFARLWLALPGNELRAKRFLAPLRNGAREIRLPVSSSLGSDQRREEK
jgi:hypothetical protein